MEHTEAVQIKAAEKYVLRELPEDVREAYEQHFFDCAECAADIQAAAMFAQASREIFAEEHAGTQPVHERLGVWRRWLRPAFAAPVLAPVLAAALVVVLVVGYQSSRLASNRSQVAVVAGQLSAAELPANAVRLLGDQRRGGGDAPVVRVRAGESFTLNFDFLSARKFNSYTGQLRDAANHGVLAVTIAGDLANREVNVVVPAGIVHPGKYTLAFSGVPEPAAPAGNDTQAETFTFTVEIIQ
jgi:guanyl-specific ribonuclease Sa